MAWPTSPSSVLGPAFAGFAAQFRALTGHADPPSTFHMLAARPQWLLALSQARALARSSAFATSVLDMFDAELETLTGHRPIVWPTPPTEPVAPRGDLPSLPQLSPSQHLLVCGRLGEIDLPTRAMMGALLRCAFGGDPAPDDLPEAVRLRLCGSALPPEARPLWIDGLELHAPEVTSVGEGGALRLVQDGFADPHRLQAVDPTRWAPLSLAAAVDLAMSALTLRAALRAAHELYDETLDEIELLAVG